MKEFLKTTKGKMMIACGVLVVVAIIIAAVLFFGKKEGFRTISVAEISGSAMVMHDGREYDAYTGMKLQEGYALTTGEGSQVRMILDEDKYIKLEENSRLIFETLGKEGSGRTNIILEYGAVTSEAATGLAADEEFIINTPNSVLAIKGTFFRVEVREDENGEILTDVYTYGGVVKSQRILPTGEIVEENVLIEAGYKTTVSMDSEETIYVVEKVEEGKENTEPIKIEDIPDGDLVDMYVASSNGHAMFIEVEEIWDVIEEREIEIEDYTSNRDGQTVTPPENNSNDNNDDGNNNNGNDSNEEGHQHTEVTVTEEATCTENGSERVECSECGTVISEKIIEATGHVTERVVKTEATETTDGLAVIQCTICDKVLEEIVIPANHSHTYETVTIDPTCTVDGQTVTRCSVCLEEKEKTIIPATGHNVDETIREATFTQTGSVFRFCMTCNAVLESSTLPKLDPLCTDDGDIHITREGFYTDANPELIPYTGTQYIITQKSASQVNCNIYFEENPKSITVTLDGVNILGSIIATNAHVGLHGNDKANQITAVGHDSAIKNNNGLVIYSGTWTFTSAMYAVEHTGFQFAIFGGVVTLDGGTYDVYGDDVEFYGGSIWLKHGTISGVANMNGLELESRIYDYYPTTDERAYLVTDYEQWYSLEETEISSDGKYHIWMPKNQVRVDEYHFADNVLRDYVTEKIDQNADGYLLEDEINATTEIIILSEWGTIVSMEGIEYFTELITLRCQNGSPITTIDLSKNTKLETLAIEGTSLYELDLSNNVNLHTLDLSGCTSLTSIDLSNCPNLSYLNITDCPMAYVDLENTSMTGDGFKGSNNIYESTGLNGSTFNAANIPGIDISKISNVTGADYDPTTGMFTNITGDQLEYVYDCGNGIMVEFVIKFI